MIRWSTSLGNGLGFDYYPFWEIAVGWFLMVCSVTVPVLFVRFNGLQVKQYPEWFFCLGFLFFFLWMGKTLAFQSFRVRATHDDFRISHNLRSHGFSYQTKTTAWKGTQLGEIRDEQGKISVTRAIALKSMDWPAVPFTLRYRRVENRLEMCALWFDTSPQADWLELRNFNAFALGGDRSPACPRLKRSREAA